MKEINIKIKATNSFIDVSYFFSFKSFLKIFSVLKNDAGKATLRGFCCRFIDTLTLKMDAEGKISAVFYLEGSALRSNSLSVSVGSSVFYVC